MGKEQSPTRTPRLVGLKVRVTPSMAQAVARYQRQQGKHTTAQALRDLIYEGLKATQTPRT